MAKATRATKATQDAGGPAKKTPARKTPTRKKTRTAKKKTRAKKASSKKTRRRSTSKKVTKRNPLPTDIDVQSNVWEAYERTRSIRGVAKETGYPEDVIRQVIRSDEDRFATITEDFREAIAAEWERKEVEAHGIANDLLALFRNLIDEIDAAAKAGRTTIIRGKNGVPLPVIDAMTLITTSSMLNQVSAIAQIGRKVSESVRLTGQATNDDDGDPVKTGRIDKMNDVDLARFIQDAGIQLTPMMQRRVKIVENEAGGRAT